MLDDPRAAEPFSGEAVWIGTRGSSKNRVYMYSEVAALEFLQMAPQSRRVYKVLLDCPREYVLRPPVKPELMPKPRPEPVHGDGTGYWRPIP